MMGLSTIGSISLGCALVAGRNRVPKPAAGKTALRTFCAIGNQSWSPTKKAPGKNLDAEFLRIPNNRRKLLLWHKGRDIIRKRNRSRIRVAATALDCYPPSASAG